VVNGESGGKRVNVLATGSVDQTVKVGGTFSSCFDVPFSNIRR
jgi:hypothetical protein